MLRPYQIEAVSQIRTEFKKGNRRVMLHLSTGAGKTVCFSHMLDSAAQNGKKAIMVVRGRQIVDQTSRRLFQEGVSHGTLLAGHWNKNYGASVQVCSIDTLIARKLRPEADLIVIDEAHLAVSEGYKNFLKDYPNAYMVSCTATPYSKESMEHLAQIVVHPVTFKDLVDQGYLVNARSYAPSTPDLKGVRRTGDDYNNAQLEERMNILTGDIPAHWLKFAENRPTICFAVNIKHSLSLVNQFNKAGIPAEHIEGDHSFEERKAAIERLERGEIKILSNVGVLCTGVDMPFVGCILMARPTQSYSLYVQQAGRGTRIFPDKSDFILLDHAGNVLRHGFITDEPQVFLEGWKKNERGPKVTMCEECFVIFEGPECHVCGWSRPVAPGGGDRDVEIEGGILEELKHLPRAAEISVFIRRMKDIQRRKGYHYGWLFHKVEEKYDSETAEAAFPRRRSAEAPWFAGRARKDRQ
jgi:DNA repair protein RadD